MKIVRNTCKTLLSGAKSYFEATSIHGFQYVIGAKSLLARLFWIASICLAFFLCSRIVKKALEEADLHPTYSFIEDVEIAMLDTPAISVLAPKNLNVDAYAVQVLNAIDVCDVNAEKSENPLLKAYLPVIKRLNEHMRGPYLYRDPFDVYNRVKDTFDFTLYPAFCSLARNMDAEEFEKMVEMVKEAVDGLVFVSNVTKLLEEHVKIDKSVELPTECSDPLGDLRVITSWLDLVVPYEQRKQDIFQCSPG